MSIPKVVKKVLSGHKSRSHPTLNDVLEVDQWARHQARRAIAELN